MVRQIQCSECGSITESHVTIHPLSWSITGPMHFATCAVCNTFLEVFQPKNLHDLWYSEVANKEA